MSSDRESSWESLPPQLKTSKLAYAIDPEGAADAADNFDTRLFWGRYQFHSLSLPEVGAYLWGNFGEQMQAQSDEELLVWLKHMEFRDHVAFEAMNDAEVIQVIRTNEQILVGYMDRYPRCDDFTVAFANAGMTPSQDPTALRGQIRTLFSKDPELRAILPEMIRKSATPSPSAPLESAE